jgi:hypothetical protein
MGWGAGATVAAAAATDAFHHGTMMVGGVKAHEVFLIVTHAPSLNLRGC